MTGLPASCASFSASMKRSTVLGGFEIGEDHLGVRIARHEGDNGGHIDIRLVARGDGRLEAHATPRGVDPE